MEAPTVELAPPESDNIQYIPGTTEYTSIMNAKYPE